LIGIIDQYRPAAVVLDSSNPYPGVLEAVACRPGVSLIWVRRGMWRATQDNSEFLTRAPFFDKIIEPQDIAEATDPDPWCAPRVVKVPPIGLLEEDELLPQREARAALRLPPDPPPGGSVLVQLGSGTTRDLDTLLDEVLGCLRQFPGLEIVLAQWLNTASAYDARWPGVQILSGFPIPRYYRAFDFTISAAGYNSFNDLLRFGLPTIFVANDAPNMDDQGARARFAELAEAAFDVRENDLSPLGDCVAAILQPQVRAFLQERSRAIALPNGALAAAQAIMETLQ
jgi:UDP:flavonoid glycosyltransferase YjiC (YdhE family)